MSTTVATKPAAPAVTKGKAKVAKPAVPSGDELTKLVTDIRSRWNVADKGETDARKLFESADIAWQNARVIKVRVAHAAAMLTPYQGEANLLAATRYLLLSDEELAGSAASIKKLATQRKSTLRNYVDAGVALEAAGLSARITEPDDEERKIVAAVFREGNKRDKAESKGSKPEGDGEGEGSTGEGEGEDLSLTYADLVGHVAQMNKVLDMMIAGSVVVSEREAGNMADMLNSFQLKLSAYSEGK